MAAPLFGVPIPLEPIPAQFRRVADLVVLLDQAEPEIRRAFLEAIGRARGLRTLERIAELIASGRIDQAMDAIDRSVPAFVSALEGVFRAAGVEVARGAAAHLGTLLDFDSVNDRAVTSLQRTRARLIRELGDEQRRATLAMLQEFQDLGEDPRVQARILRDSIGLTERQARAVGNYRRLLLQRDAEALQRKLRDRRFDSSVRAHVRGDRTLTRAQIDRMVTRYRERYVDFRARTIARTETVRAVHEGQEEMLEQLVSSGAVDASQIRREWRTARDERVRPSHVAMHRQRRRVGETFISGDGNRLRYPGDPSAPPEDTVQCRCVLAVSVPRLSRRVQAIE